MWLPLHLLLCLLIWLPFPTSEAAKILGFFFMPSVSHQEVFQPIWKELSLRGHNVTVITPNPLNNPELVNLTEIDISFTYKYMNLSHKSFRQRTVIENIFFYDHLVMALMKAELEHEGVQQLLNNTEEQFDLVLVESIHPIVFGFGGRFKAPIVGLSSLDATLPFHDATGNPTHPVLRPDAYIHFYGEPTFLDRLTSFLHNIWFRAIYYWRLLPKADAIARKYFGNDIPYLGDLVKNTNLFLISTNPLVNNPVPNVPAIVNIGQVHIKDKKPLPKDLQEYMDNSTRGVVYFSLGSNVKSMNLGEEMIKTILEALGGLPYDVIWKWEADHLPGKPDNVLLKKWLPQQDLLGHPNLKVFVTQGGLQSIEQAILNAVPMVGIPFFVDQPTNVKTLVERGLAVGLNYETMDKDQLKQAILEVATNKKYKHQIEKSRNLLNDQPMKPLDKAIWWIEHAIRHEGAPHLRSPGADMSFFQYFMVDVIGFLLISVYVSMQLLKKLFRLFTTRKADKLKTT